MTAEIGALRIVLGASTAAFESAMKAARGALQATAGAMRHVKTAASALGDELNSFAGRAGPVGSVLQSMGPGGRVAAVGLGIATAAMGAAGVAARTAVRDLDALGKQARSLGVTAETLQTLRFVAGEQGVDVSRFEDALRRLARAQTELLNGRGELIEKMGATHPTLLREIATAETQEERLEAVRQALINAGSEAERNAIAFGVFGESGNEVARALIEMNGSLDDMAQKAADTGAIVEDHLIAKAETLENRIGNAASAIKVDFQTALVAIGPIVAGVVEKLAGLVDMLGRILQRIAQVQNATGDELRRRVAAANAVQDSMIARNATRARQEASLARAGVRLPRVVGDVVFGRTGTTREEMEAIERGRAAQLELDARNSVKPTTTAAVDTTTLDTTLVLRGDGGGGAGGGSGGGGGGRGGGRGGSGSGDAARAAAEADRAAAALERLEQEALQRAGRERELVERRLAERLQEISTLKLSSEDAERARVLARQIADSEIKDISERSNAELKRKVQEYRQAEREAEAERRRAIDERLRAEEQAAARILELVRLRREDETEAAAALDRARETRRAFASGEGENAARATGRRLVAEEEAARRVGKAAATTEEFRSGMRSAWVDAIRAGENPLRATLLRATDMLMQRLAGGIFDSLFGSQQSGAGLLSGIFGAGGPFNGGFGAGLPGGGGGSSGFLGGLAKAAGAIFGGFRADGGPVMPGRAYVVGERGPEMFVPRMAGSIIPNGGGRGTFAPSISVDARGLSAREAEEMTYRALKRAETEFVRNSLVATQTALPGMLREARTVG